MKKMLSILLAAVMLLAAACAATAEPADVLGDWYGDMFGMAVQLTLNEDGTYVMAVVGMPDQTNEGSWEMKEGAVIMDGDEESALAYDGETLSISEDGMSLTFGREPVESFTPAEPVKAASAEELAGSWKADYVNFSGMMLDYAAFQEMGLAEGDTTATIEGESITLSGFMFNDETLPLQFADGALSFEAEDPDSQLIAGIKAQLLEDGSLALTMEAADAVVFYMSRA